jgi:starch synthase
MKVLFAAAEVDPFAKVGGLADVAASLPRRLQDMGHDVRVVTPCHESSSEAFAQAPARRTLDVPFVGSTHRVDVATTAGAGGVPVQLVRDRQFFGRRNVYGDADDAARYQFFCRCVMQMLLEDGWTPDILHLNDWHTAPLAFGLRNLAWGNPLLRGVASVFTIHNLRYRGPDELNDQLCQAVYYSDFITTVSPTYAREILTSDYGEGLDELLRLRGDRVAGILNGLDYDLYNPRIDPLIARPFDLTSLEARSANRDALQKAVGLPVGAGPLAAMVTRLAEQKGVDLVLHALPELLAAGVQLVVLGEGDASIMDELRRLELAHPQNVRLAAGYNEALARQIYAGSDLFLMPSRYEPCGLGQLIAMRYGSVPIGRRTGGLADTIRDPSEYGDAATGFLFDEFSTFAFVGAFERAVAAFHDREGWERLQLSAMSRDYSWGASATHYVECYRAALRVRGIAPHDD